MSSLNRNIRRANSSLRTRAASAALALTLASGAALADGAHRFVFTAYIDAPGGVDVTTGRYRAALAELHEQQNAMDLDPTATNTNLCVAYSMTLQWRKARVTCDAAVQAASEQRLAAPAWLYNAQASRDESLALAYANRAVMHWMWHDEAATQQDLAKAQALAPHADFVAQNVAALEMHVTVARAAAPAPKS